MAGTLCDSCKAGGRIDQLSLDGPPDQDAESAWDAEIVRRLTEFDAGTAELIDREEVRRRMRARMRHA